MFHKVLNLSGRHWICLRRVQTKNNNNLLSNNNIDDKDNNNNNLENIYYQLDSK